MENGEQKTVNVKRKVRLKLLGSEHTACGVNTRTALHLFVLSENEGR